MMRAGSVPQPATGGMESSRSLDIHIGRWPLAAYHSTSPVRFDESVEQLGGIQERAEPRS